MRNQDPLGCSDLVVNPRYLREVFILVGFVALMVAYKPIVLGIIQVVSHLGSGIGGAPSIEETFSRRMARFGAYVDRQNQDAGLKAAIALTLDGVVARVWLLTMLVFVGVQCVMFIIKAVQLFALAAIITYGPILVIGDGDQAA